jgi:type VI secretion system protein ImpC
MSTQVAVANDIVEFADPGLFTSLLDREFKPRGDQQREAVEAAVRTLAEQALGNTVTMSDDAYASIEAIIAEIDHKLTTQINLILHHEDFQQLESAWRGLDHLVSNTETDSMLKIRFMDVSKTEMRKTLRRFKGVAWDQSPLFKRLYEEEYGQLGGEPYV